MFVFAKERVTLQNVLVRHYTQFQFKTDILDAVTSVYSAKVTVQSLTTVVKILKAWIAGARVRLVYFEEMCQCATARQDGVVARHIGRITEMIHQDIQWCERKVQIWQQLAMRLEDRTETVDVDSPCIEHPDYTRHCAGRDESRVRTAERRSTWEIRWYTRPKKLSDIVLYIDICDKELSRMRQEIRTVRQRQSNVTASFLRTPFDPPSTSSEFHHESAQMHQFYVDIHTLESEEAQWLAQQHSYGLQMELHISGITTSSPAVNGHTPATPSRQLTGLPYAVACAPNTPVSRHVTGSTSCVSNGVVCQSVPGSSSKRQRTSES